MAVEVFGDRYGIEDVSDLYLVPVSGESKWAVWSKSIRGPLSASYITPAELNQQRSILQ